MAKLRSSSLGPVGIGASALFDVKEVSDLAGYDPESAVPPEAWPDFSAGIEVEFCCAKCGYGWRGNPKPNADDTKVSEE